MYAVYAGIHIKEKQEGLRVAERLLGNFLKPGGDLRYGRGPILVIQEPWLADWFREDPNFIKWHEQQVRDFMSAAVLPAVTESCNTQPVVEWEAIRHHRESENPLPLSLSREEGAYSVIPIYDLGREIGFSLGKYFLEGRFRAENIRVTRGEVIANVAINRHVDDSFDFQGDFGGIPLHQLRPHGSGNLGLGQVSNVWAQTLVANFWARYFDVHLEWSESSEETVLTKTNW